jgi:tetratricopeptide (TPR) repeat protein
MVDLSRHLARIKQAIERRNWELALTICEECLDVDPANLDIYRSLLDAARRRAKESDKKGMFSGVSAPSFTRDPHKLLLAAMKRVATNPDAKTLAAAGDAARAVYKAGAKPLIDVAIFLYDEMVLSGLFNPEVLWNLAHLYFERFQDKKEPANLESALKTMAKLEAAMPQHPEAGRTLKNWEARKSMERRNQSSASGDYRSQLSSDSAARRADIMNRIVRTSEDASEVLHFIEEDLKTHAADKALWVKRGEIFKRIGGLALIKGAFGEATTAFNEARISFEKGQKLDEHDFTITMRLSDLAMEEQKNKISELEVGGQDATALKQEAIQYSIAEYRKRVARQPTDMGHKYNLGLKLLESGQIEAAAGEFQRTVADPRYRLNSHKYMGYCFGKKNMLDLAVKNYTSYLSLVEDNLSDGAKEVRYLRARQLEDLKKREEAMADYSQLVEIDLGYKDAAARLDNLRNQG